MSKNKHLILISLACLSLASFKVADSFFEISKNLEIFSSVYKEVNKSYVDEVQPGTLIKKGIDAMLDGLDPYTNFYSENQAEKALIDRMGEYGGVGCRIALRDERIQVTEVFTGYAFHNADVRAGDIIKSINGKDLYKSTISDASVLLRGSANTTFQMVVDRDGNSINKSIDRMQVVNKSVPYFAAVNKNTAYIKLDEFGRDAASEIRNAIVSLNKDNAIDNVILDLRFNGGGLLNEAVDIVGLFVGKNKQIVDMRGRTSRNNKKWQSSMNPVALKKKLVILVNERSASASEVVSASIQDLDRGVVIGQNSFGKGLVQNYFQLPYRTQMKITTAKYYTPSGRCIQLLDYSHRQTDGTVGAIPDSLRREFKSVGGRIVKDGGGVQPDVTMEPFGGLSIYKQLQKFFISSDFANKYRNSNDKLIDINFLSDAEVNTFINDASIKLSEELKEEMSKSLGKQFSDEQFVAQILTSSALLTSIKNETTTSLNANKNIIKHLLEVEIIKRYHLEDLKYKKMFQSDPEILKAIEVMNGSTYAKLLKN